MTCKDCGEEIRCDLSYRTTTGLAYFHVRPWIERGAGHQAEPWQEHWEDTHLGTEDADE